jgi:hypothetical protein
MSFLFLLPMKLLRTQPPCQKVGKICDWLLVRGAERRIPAYPTQHPILTSSNLPDTNINKYEVFSSSKDFVTLG